MLTCYWGENETLTTVQESGFSQAPGTLPEPPNRLWRTPNPLDVADEDPLSPTTEQANAERFTRFLGAVLDRFVCVGVRESISETPVWRV